MKSPAPFHIPLVAGVCLLIFAATGAQAANTWDGGSGLNSNWGTADNWDNDVVPAANQTLTFAGGTRLDPFNDTVSRQVKAFIFAAGAEAFTLTGNDITLTGNLVSSVGSISNLSANTQTINLNMATTQLLGIVLSNNAVTLGGVISGSGGLKTVDAWRASQSGTITLSGDNTFTGGVQLVTDAGYTKILNIGHANALGTGLLTISGGSTASNRIDNTSGADMTIANNVSALGGGSGDGPTVRFLGTNNLTINGTFSNGSGNRQIQVNANTLTLAGKVYLAADNNAVATLTTAGLGNLTIGGVVSNNAGVGGFAGGIKVLDSATLELLNRSNTYTGTTILGTNYTSPTLVVTKLADGGQSSSIGASSNAAANLVTVGVSTIATLRYTGSGDSTDRLFSIMDSYGTFKIESSGSGALHFTNAGAISVPGTTGGDRTLELGGTYTGGANIMDSNLTGEKARLRKEGAGTWNLTNTSGYAGTTTVNAGTLLVSGAGSINASDSITVNDSGSRFSYTSSTGLDRNVTLATGGEFFHSGSTDYSGTLTWTNGVVGGTNWNGASLDNLTVNTNRTISPGNSPGTAVTVDQTWGTDGSYIWEINDAAGTMGADPGWDLLSGTGTLAVSATSVDPFTIYVTSLTLGNSPGNAANFNAGTSYEWRLADFANPVTGFSSDKFAIDTTGFTNASGPGSLFSVVLGNDLSITGGDNTQIYLTYTAVPEPNTALLLGVVGVATLLLRRRSKRAVA